MNTHSLKPESDNGRCWAAAGLVHFDASVSLHFLLAAAVAAVEGDQLAALGVELALGNNLPLVKAAAAQGFALVLLLGGGAFEGDNIIGHGVVGHRSSQARCGKSGRLLTAPIQKAIQGLGLRIPLEQITVKARRHAGHIR